MFLTHFHKIMSEFVVYYRKRKCGGNEMTLEELLLKVPELETYIRYMPEELKKPVHNQNLCTKNNHPSKG